MDDVKDKMKGFMKKVSSSSSPKFKGQGRTLGTSSSSSNPIQSLRQHQIPSSEPALSAHVDLCLPTPPPPPPLTSEVAESVNAFMGGGPTSESVEIVLKLFKNVIREPGNDKFRRIRMGNPKIKEALGGDPQGTGSRLLESIGFRINEQEDGGEVWATMEVPTEDTVKVVREAVSLLETWNKKEETAASVKNIIDRKVRVFFSVSESVAANIDLLDSFYNLSFEEAKREAESRRKKMAESQLLIPKSYKEKQANATRKKYKMTVIRIQFPDGVVLQGIFLPSESTTVLYEFVSSALKAASLEFELLSPAVSKLRVIPHFPRPGDTRTPTLEEERLVPSALVKFKPIETDTVVFTGLINELLEVSEPLTSATTVL